MEFSNLSQDKNQPNDKLVEMCFKTLNEYNLTGLLKEENCSRIGKFEDQPK